MNPVKLKHWHPFTGILHFCIALFTTINMLTGLFLPTALWVLPHGISGSLLALTVLIHWIWSFCYQNKAMLHHQFPYTKELRKTIGEDLRNLFKFKIPVRGRPGGLPGMVEGFGLIAITIMSLSGPFLFGNYLIHTDHLSTNFYWLLNLHGFFANFVWIYWCGHVGMALLTFYLERKKSI